MLRYAEKLQARLCWHVREMARGFWQSSNLSKALKIEIPLKDLHILNFKQATIIKSEGNDVIGCVYSIDKENLAELDRQEGVHQNIYEPLEISVLSSDGTEYVCRTYWKKDVADGKTGLDLPSKVQFKASYIQRKYIFLGLYECDYLRSKRAQLS